MANDVEIKITGRDDSGAAFDSAIAKNKALEATVTRSYQSQAKAAKLLHDPLVQAALDTDRWAKSSTDASGTLHVLSDAASKTSNDLDFLKGSGSGTSLAGSGMTGLIGAGVALAPVIATVGTGLGGLGLAAMGLVGPIEKAAGKAGGLKANMGSLDSEQKIVARSVLDLGKSYDAFQKALQPTLVADFNKAIGVAKPLLSDIEPVAKATGEALGGLLTQLGGAFKSGEWQNFFKFMAGTAKQDVQLLGQSFVNLVNTLPPLLEQLQPLSMALLRVVEAGTKVIQFAANLKQHQDELGVSPRNLVSWQTLEYGIKRAIDTLAPGVPVLQKWIDHQNNASIAAARQAEAQQALNDRIVHTNAATTDLLHPLGSFTGGLQSAKVATDNEKTAVTLLTGALNKMSNGLLTSEGDQVAWKQAQQAATKAIDANHKSLDGNSAAALNARQAIIQSTSAALAFAQQQQKTGHDTAGASQTLRDQIQWLKEHAGKSKIAHDEIDALRQALVRVKDLGNINTTVNVIGRGRGGISFQDQIAGQRSDGTLEFHAAGGPVGGVGTGTSDSNLIAASRGEYVVKAASVAKYGTHMMDAINAGSFAAGGLVGDDTVLTRGIGYVSSHGASFMRSAELAAIHDAKQALVSMARSVSGAVPGAGTPGGGAPAANAALARRMYPAWGSGAEWAAWNAVAMRESGWSQYARNASSGAYGIAQALPPTKYPFAGQAAGGSHPGAQIAWMVQYILGRYGDPIGAWQHELSAGWYDHGGWLKPGWNLAYNGTGAPEPVGAAAGGRITLVIEGKGQYGQFLANEIKKLVRVDGGGDVQVAFGTRS